MDTTHAKTLVFLMLTGCGAPAVTVKNQTAQQGGVDNTPSAPSSPQAPAADAPPVAVVTIGQPLADFVTPNGVSPATPLDPNTEAPFGDGALVYIWPSSLKDPNAISPADLAIDAGVWGTDVLRSDTVALSGASSLQLAGTVAGVSTAMVPIEGDNQRYLLTVAFHTDRAQTTDKTTITATFYAADKTTVVKTVPMSYGVHLDTVNWLRVTNAVSLPTGARWVKVSVSKTTNFNIYVDRIEVQRMAAAMTLYQDSSVQSAPAGNWYFVALSGTVAPGDDYNDCVPAHILTVPESLGVSPQHAARWLVDGRVSLQAVPAGTTVRVRFVDYSGTVLDAGTQYVAAATGDQTFQALAMVNAPQSIFMQVWHNAPGGSLRILGANKPSPTALSAIALP